MKIGLGIITCDRPALLKKACESIPSRVDSGIIVNDGKEMDQLHPYGKDVIAPYDWSWHETDGRIGVGKSKNIALKHLYNDGCDYIFLMEDDIFVKDPTVFEKYIEASQQTGIQHFNFSQHGMMNKAWPDGTPNPRTIINYGTDKVNIPLYPHCVGAFSMYSRKCLEECGFMDERYYNACEHVDHTYEIIKNGMHPPFWFFADIENSWEYLGDEEWSIEKSTISSNPKHKQMMDDADKIFVEKHGHLPGQTKDVPEQLGTILKQIKKEYGI